MGSKERMMVAAPCECPVETTLSVISGKWTTVILWRLRFKRHRFSELRRQLPMISQKVLTQHLRDLETRGVVHRKIYAEVPPRVEYSLTELGDSLEPILEAMRRWGESYQRRFGRDTGERDH